jgi:hypothetical protein
MTAERDDLELNRFWNDVVAGDPVDESGLDAADARLIRQLNTLANAPLPVSARERVWRGLLDTYVSIPDDKEQTMLTANEAKRSDLPRRNGHAQRILPHDPPDRRMRWLYRPVTYAAVAALLLAIIGGFAASQIIGPDDSRPWRDGQGIFAAGSPSSGEVQATTLLEVNLPADVVPADDMGSMDLARSTIPANSVTTRSAWECCPGAKIYFILDGSVTLESDGPINVVLRADAGALEEIAGGESVDLGPGDAVAVRHERSLIWTTGAAEVNIVTMAMVSGLTFGSFDPAEWISHGSQIELESITLPGGPYILTLSQATIDADVTLPLPHCAINQLLIVQDGKAVVGKNSDGSISVAGIQAPATVLSLRLSAVTKSTGTPVACMGA